MTRAPHKRCKLTLGILLFLASQLFATAHASEFGTAAHEHSGYACLALSVDDHDGLAPAADLCTPALRPGTSTTLLMPVPKPTDAGAAVRPPATGPPSI
jgi:hypothetical protein